MHVIWQENINAKVILYNFTIQKRIICNDNSEIWLIQTFTLERYTELKNDTSFQKLHGLQKLIK